MLFNNLKKFINKFPILWKFLTWSKDHLLHLSRLKDVLIMMLLLHIWPEQTYRFSTRKFFLGDKKNKFSKTSRPTIPYELLKDKTSNIPYMKEITVVGRGSSFDLNKLKEIDGPIFLVSFNSPLRIDKNDKVFYDHFLPVKFLSKRREYSYKAINFKKYEQLFNFETTKEFKRDNLTYVSSRDFIVKLFKKNGNNVLAPLSSYKRDKNGNAYSNHKSLESPSYPSMFDNDQCRHIAQIEKIYKPPHYWAPTGSFLPALCALSHFAGKINVYGWDNHLNFSPEKMGYWQLLFKMYKYKFDTRSWKAQFEHALINFYYGYQLSKLPNINIYGYLGQLDKHEKLIKRIERVLFN